MSAVTLEKLLPEDVPAGERILWHGRPRWLGLARRAFRADFVAAYFVALTAWSAWSALGSGWRAGGVAGLEALGLGAAALAIIAGLSVLSARTTLYVVTSRRLVLKVGIALPVFINVPFKDIAAGAVRIFGDGTGDIPLRLTKGRRIGYLMLWPHARPFHLLNPQPCLRSVANAAMVAETLAVALREASGQLRAAGFSSRDARAEHRAEVLAFIERSAA